MSHQKNIELYRVLKNNRHFYLFCDQETMFVVKPIAEQVGFKFWKPIVWDILFFEKGKKKLNNLSIPDILPTPGIYNGYPTEKPVKLSEILINQS